VPADVVEDDASVDDDDADVVVDLISGAVVVEEALVVENGDWFDFASSAEPSGIALSLSQTPARRITISRRQIPTNSVYGISSNVSVEEKTISTVRPASSRRSSASAQLGSLRSTCSVLGKG